ncbi:MAG: type II toxin-antitoxin system RelE/ParE family toxin [Acidobacteria bacterium]|nr:type II toxin-antitoxin system RelE/ParE family toxin [Acidobacteriota bacterium]
MPSIPCVRYAVKLTNPAIGQYRFRVGDYRIVFDLSESTLVIVAVGHRKDIYR